MVSKNQFLESRDFLLANRTHYEAARRGFVWPRTAEFNWALDYFDPMAVGNESQALWIVEESGEECRLSFAHLAARSNQVANWLCAHGVQQVIAFCSCLATRPRYGGHARRNQAGCGLDSELRASRAATTCGIESRAAA
jgi:hypothetical protein